MKKILNEFLQNFTFERQLGIMVTLGILFLALFSSLVGSWQSNERVRHNLLEQGQQHHRESGSPECPGADLRLGR